MKATIDPRDAVWHRSSCRQPRVAETTVGAGTWLICLECYGTDHEDTTDE